MNNIFFTIIIATFNVNETIKKCIDSINNQSFDNYEVLISDGGSSDGTHGFIKSGYIKNLSWFKSEIDNGIYHALNQALDHASGKWVLVLGADDYISDIHSLQRIFNEIINKNLESGIIYTDLLIKRGNLVINKIYPNIEEFNKKYNNGAIIHHQSAFISLKSILEAGKFSVFYKIHSDYDLMLSIQKKYKSIKIDGFYVVFNDSGYSSRLSNLKLSFFEFYNIRLKHGYKPMPWRISLLFISILIRRLFSFLFTFNDKN